MQLWTPSKAKSASTNHSTRPSKTSNRQPFLGEPAFITGIARGSLQRWTPASVSGTPGHGEHAMLPS
jgi:hypothetical protein